MRQVTVSIPKFHDLFLCIQYTGLVLLFTLTDLLCALSILFWNLDTLQPRNKYWISLHTRHIYTMIWSSHLSDCYDAVAHKIQLLVKFHLINNQSSDTDLFRGSVSNSKENKFHILFFINDDTFRISLQIYAIFIFVNCASSVKVCLAFEMHFYILLI